MTMSQEFFAGSIDVASFWRILSHRAVGATVVTARGPAGRAGFLGLSAAHVSASPPRMLISVEDNTSARSVIVESDSFVINILAKDQQAIAEKFGGKGGHSAEARFEGANWRELSTGAPVLEGALGAFDCRIETECKLSGVLVIIGRVEAALLNENLAPLVFFKGGYTQL